MKIAVVTSRHTARDDRVYYKEARSLARRHRVWLVAPWGVSDGLWTDDAVKLVPLRRRQGLVGRALSLLDVVVAIRRLRPEVCHFHDPDLLVVLALLKIVLKTRLVYDVHEFVPESLVQHRVRGVRLRSAATRVLLSVERSLARRCDAVVCAVEPLAGRFRAEGRLVATVFNYPRVEMIDGAAMGEPASWPGGVDGRPVVLYQGTISRDRGLFLCIDAMAQLAEDGNVPLMLFVGEVTAALRAEADAVIGRRNLSASIIFAGGVPHLEVFRLMRRCTMGVVPFLPVGQYPWAIPIKLFEYWACSLPVAAARLPSVVPYVEESGGGRLFEAASASALAKAIGMMLSDRGECVEMGRRGRQAVEARWNWAAMEDRLVGLYSQIAGRGDCGGAGE